jgi:TM2 domain-containing membrane protein YozV
MTIKDKNIAGLLALFLGPLGVHRFYLDQVGLGIFYLIFFWFPLTWLIAFVDAIILLSMDKDKFDARYNHGKIPSSAAWRSKGNTRQRAATDRHQAAGGRVSSGNKAKVQELRAAGIKKFKEFDYDGAIKDFEEALQLEPKDLALHFNLACAYSLNEKAEKAFFHIDRAVALGFKDFKRIKEHDALAFLRIQSEFEHFEKNGFQRTTVLHKKSDNDAAAVDLLEQLNRLGDLRERGLLSEEEFFRQKQKLLNT